MRFIWNVAFDSLSHSGQLENSSIFSKLDSLFLFILITFDYFPLFLKLVAISSREQKPICAQFAISMQTKPQNTIYVYIVPINTYIR